jgi:hypothetical protein
MYIVRTPVAPFRDCSGYKPPPTWLRFHIIQETDGSKDIPSLRTPLGLNQALCVCRNHQLQGSRIDAIISVITEFGAWETNKRYISQVCVSFSVVFVALNLEISSVYKGISLQLETALCQYGSAT